jgi:MFS family permease
VPFHDQLGQVLAGMTVAGVGSGALVAALPAAAAAAAPAGRTAVATGLTNTTKVIGGMFASSVFALALAAGTPVLAGGVAGTAGSLTGYVTVWTICGTTALIAAVALVFVPRLAFADRTQTEDRAVAGREETAG